MRIVSEVEAIFLTQEKQKENLRFEDATTPHGGNKGEKKDSKMNNFFKFFIHYEHSMIKIHNNIHLMKLTKLFL